MIIPTASFKGILPPEQPAAGGESRERDSYLGANVCQPRKE